MSRKLIDGRTYTQCDSCGKFNISLDEGATVVEFYHVPVYGLDDPEKTSYLLCPECSKKFTKLMGDFVNAQN